MSERAAVATPVGYSTRPATWEDLAALVELFRQSDLVDWGEVDVTEVSIRHDWEDPQMDLATGTWLMFEESGPEVSELPIAYASLLALDSRHTQLEAWGLVHPKYRGRGLGSHLIDLVEERAAVHLELAPADGPVLLRQGLLGPDQAAHRLVESRGYRPVRYFWRMDTPLTDDLQEPRPVLGVRIRPFAPGRDDRAVYAVNQEAFAGAWGFVPRGFEEWSRHRFRESGFDPSKWFVAESDEGIVGVLQGLDDEGVAWVGMLGVRPSWQRKGIGEALLRHSFIEFRRLGYDRVGLAVDTENPTGATGLYERVGMTVTRQFDFYEKRLR